MITAIILMQLTQGVLILLLTKRNNGLQDQINSLTNIIESLVNDPKNDKVLLYALQKIHNDYVNSERYEEAKEVRSYIDYLEKQNEKK